MSGTVSIQDGQLLLLPKEQGKQPEWKTLTFIDIAKLFIRDDSSYLSGREDSQQYTGHPWRFNNWLFTNSHQWLPEWNVLTRWALRECQLLPLCTLLLPYLPPSPFLFFLTYYPCSRTTFLGRFLQEDFKGMKDTRSQNVKVWWANGSKGRSLCLLAPKITHWATDR